MAKIKTIYSCNQCGAQSPKWVGQCADCGAWNTLVEETIVPASSSGRVKNFSGEERTNIITAAEVSLQVNPRISTLSPELDRVLGGGLVFGAAVLIGGDPGIGKSTLLLQTLSHISEHHTVLYVTGEESLQQITLRARRLGLSEKKLHLLADTQVESIIVAMQKLRPQVVVIDSIQTMYTQLLQSAPGGVSQVRESAGQLVQFAKQTSTALFLVGHVTREGTIAGPRVLEHMVDTVLYFEGDNSSRFRVIRAVKNRFGAVNEIGIFAMSDKGLAEVNNPSAIFLSNYDQPAAGSVVMVTWEGTRPLLVEIQALVDKSYLTNPRRVTVGLEQNRLAMLLAVLHRHGGIVTYDQDVFVNAVGGVRVLETAADLAMLVAAISSLRNRPLAQGMAVFGEVGLTGEIRPVQNGQERIKEAAKHGFKRIVVPKANAPKKNIFGEIEIVAVDNLPTALDAI